MEETEEVGGTWKAGRERGGGGGGMVQFVPDIQNKSTFVATDTEEVSDDRVVSFAVF